MTLEQTKEKLLKGYKVLWTDWQPVDDFKMKKVENKNVRWLIERLIEKAFEAGFDRASEIDRPGEEI